MEKFRQSFGQAIGSIKEISHKMTSEEKEWYVDFCKAERGDKEAIYKLAPDENTARRIWAEVCYERNTFNRHKHTTNKERKARYTIRDYVNSPGVNENQMIRLIDRGRTTSDRARKLINSRQAFEAQHERETLAKRREANESEARAFKQHLQELTNRNTQINRSKE